MQLPFIVVLELNLNKFNWLNDKSKASLRNLLSEVKLLMIDKISMVSINFWTDIGSRLGRKIYDNF